METAGLNPETCNRTSTPLKTVIIGAGNVAWTLAPALDHLEGVKVVQVWSRHLANSHELARRLTNAEATDSLAAIVPDGDLYLVSAADDAIAEIAGRIADQGRCNPNAVAAHTSGGVDASVLAPMTPHYGVFYPLQTFTRGLTVDLRPVPLLVEGADPRTTAVLERLASQLSDKVSRADSRRRAVIHAAAVFACNFSNHFFARADDILRREGLELEVLYPLIRETVQKAMTIPPAEGQTGPARRGDLNCIRHHEELLQPEERALYSSLSESIMDYYHKD